MFNLSRLYRINFRIKFSRITIFFMLSLTQKMLGVNSLADVTENTHYPLWDIDHCSLDEAEETLRFVQKKYGLSTIYIASDYLNSFRAWCFCRVDFKTFLKILLDTRYVDKMFFDYAVKNNKATLRISAKEGREQQEIISMLESYYQPIPKRFSFKEYDTSYDKRALNIIIGDKN